MARPDSWFRLYNSVVDDPKIQQLEPELFKAWVNLLCIASKNGGHLPSNTDLAFSLRVSSETLCNILERFTDLLLLDLTKHGLIPHNWNDRQFKSDNSTVRVHKHRAKVKRFKTVSHTVSETPPETETEQNIDIEDTPPISPPPGNVGLQVEFDEWWLAQANKVGKPAARKAYFLARKKVDAGTLLVGYRRYAAGKPPDRSWLNPATFLNQERWNDQPGKVNGNGKISYHDDVQRHLTGLARAVGAGGVAGVGNAALQQGAPSEDPGPIGEIMLPGE